MKKDCVLTVKNLFLDLAIAGTLLLLFMVLGYISREFALEIQTNILFGDWGFF
ncbi:hypothetical protein KAI58_00665 [Candidatus Gracilibacteria bacterium]|nr:hypothetical protein [Candidatus Gracilibacteria bacterium]